MDLTRRSLLRAGATASVATLPALAGCTDDAAADGYAVLFALADAADEIAGDRLRVANPVPTGAHGHGWSPGSDLQTDVAASQLFVYLDHPQWSWAQNMVRNLEDEAVDVRTVDALAGVDLVEWDAEHGEHDEEAGEADHGNDTDDGSRGESDHDDGDHDDRGRFDPHVWLDPVRAETVVETIADALVEVDPEGESTFRHNAATYADDLATLHQEFEAAVAAAERTTVVLAGHNSFQYIAARYGIEFETPTGVSPDEQASQADLVDLIELVDEQGIEYVLYDQFEGDEYARAIVEDSDAEAALPLTPLASTTEQWADQGFPEQMREVNLTNLRRAMGSD